MDVGYEKVTPGLGERRSRLEEPRYRANHVVGVTSLAEPLRGIQRKAERLLKRVSVSGMTS